MSIGATSTSAQIIQEGGIPNLNGNGLDQANQNMNVWFGHTCDLFLLNGQGSQCCDGGVVLDIEEMFEIANGSNVDPRGILTYYALGHERTHYCQVQTFGSMQAFLSEYAAEPHFYELEADFVSGVHLGIRLLEDDHNFLQLAPIANFIGNTFWPKGNHPSPFQRAQAITRGLNVGATSVQLRQNITCPEARDMGQQLAKMLLAGNASHGFFRF